MNYKEIEIDESDQKKDLQVKAQQYLDLFETLVTDFAAEGIPNNPSSVYPSYMFSHWSFV